MNKNKYYLCLLVSLKLEIKMYTLIAFLKLNSKMGYCIDLRPTDCWQSVTITRTLGSGAENRFFRKAKGPG